MEPPAMPPTAPGDRIAGRADRYIFGDTASSIAGDRATNQLDDEIDESARHCLPFSDSTRPYLRLVRNQEQTFPRLGRSPSALAAASVM
jgi:hypothetical protein